MLSAVSRQAFLALFLSALIFGVSSGRAAAEESTLYKLGRATAYASHCGHRDLVTELQARYGDYRDFRVGRQKNDLQRYDYVRLACGKLKSDLEDYLKKERARIARERGNGDELQAMSEEDKQAVLGRIYTDIMKSILAKDAMWAPDGRGRLTKPIGEYRSTVVHGRQHKSLAACFRWEAEESELRYLTWSADIHSSWAEAKHFALVQCRNLRFSNNLKCKCFSVDHNDENVLSLPEFILTHYQGIVDAEVRDEGDQLGLVN